MQTRTTRAIALRPAGNARGGYYFFSLMTGRRLNRSNWTDLPMPQDVIDRVHTFARRSNANRALLFAWRDGTPITDDADDADDTESNPSDKSDSEDDDSYTGDCHDDADDEYPPDALDIPFAGVLDKNENNIPDENEHEIEGVPEEPELEVEVDKGAADDPAAISDDESDESDA
jgi:hypothetical protein